MRKWALASVVFLILIAFASPHTVVAEGVQQAPASSSALDLLNAVNALRASHGLPPYQANPILMGITQSQADYLASSGQITHTGADGSLPYQRALTAGYPLAGDISLGGYYSENVAAATNMTAQDAVTLWMGDAPHQNTMLSSVYKDAGVGMAVSGGIYYFALDAGLSTGGTAVPYTPQPQSVQPSYTPVAPAGTQATGASIVYVVQTGDTLDGIAQTWGVSVAAILQSNNLTLISIIYPGQKLAIPVTLTPTPPSTSTLSPTPAPTDTQVEIPTVLLTATPTPTSVSSPKAITPMTGVFISGIGVLLLIVAGLLVFNRARSGS